MKINLRICEVRGWFSESGPGLVIPKCIIFLWIAEA